MIAAAVKVVIVTVVPVVVPVIVAVAVAAPVVIVAPVVVVVVVVGRIVRSAARALVPASHYGCCVWRYFLGVIMSSKSTNVLNMVLACRRMWSLL